LIELPGISREKDILIKKSHLSLVSLLYLDIIKNRRLSALRKASDLETDREAMLN